MHFKKHRLDLVSGDMVMSRSGYLLMVTDHSEDFIEVHPMEINGFGFTQPYGNPYSVNIQGKLKENGIPSNSDLQYRVEIRQTFLSYKLTTSPLEWV